jgi:hypothetical protein
MRIIRFLSLRYDDFFAFVITARTTYVVGLNESSAVFALYGCGALEKIMRTAHITAGTSGTLLWIRH